MKSHQRHTLFAVVLLLALFTINWLNNSEQETLPNIAFTDIDGQQHSLHDFHGKPTLVIFWATDCPGCIQEMPELITLHKEYSDQGLAMIGVAMAHDSIKHIKAMRTEKKLPYLIAWDQSSQIAHAFDNVRVTPTHFLINPEGEITMRKIGTLNMELLHEKLQSMGLSPNQS